MKNSMRILALLLVISTGPLFGASKKKGIEFSVFGMVTASQLKSASVVSDAHLGFGGGLLAEKKFGESFGIEAGLAYGQRANGYESTATLNVTSHLSLPVLLKLRLGAITIGAGGYGAIGIGSVKTTVGASTSTRTYAEAGLKTLDYGLAASAGLTIGAFFFEARYTYGLADVDATGAGKTTYNDILGLVGINF